MIKKLMAAYTAVIKSIKTQSAATALECPDSRDIFSGQFKEFDLRFYDFGL